MHQWFLLLHLVGLFMWFGTIAIEAFFIPAARKGDPILRVWVFGTYRRALWLEMIGLVLLLTGGIGMIAVETELLGETWFLVKVAAAVGAIALRGLHYLVLYRSVAPNPAMPGSGGSVSASDIAGVERYESLSRWTGPVSLVLIVVVLWMVLWRPF